MAAAMLSNGALFISTKTAGTSLGHSYGKVGTSHREDLARIMREASRTWQTGKRQAWHLTDAGERQAKRLRNLTRDPRVSILIDAYDDDWATVWWVRLGGNGRVAGDSPERDHAWQLLRQEYPQFADTPSEEGAGPVMAVDIEHWAGWAYTR